MVQKKKLAIIFIALVASILALGLLSCKTNKANAVYTVKFYVDGEQNSEWSAKYGSEIEFPEMENSEDNENVFIGWFTTSNYDKWFDDTTVTKNVSVYGYWSTYEDSLLTVSFYDDGTVLESYTVQKGNYIESCALPDKDDGYELDKWLVDGTPYDFNVRPLTSLELHATRKPIEYTVEFISLDECISTQIYTVENYNIKEPECPVRDHYYPGNWESYNLTKGNIKVNAVYEPIPYTVEYIDGSGTVLGTYDYTILTYKDIVPPEPTVVPGCYSYWDDLECGVTQIRLKAVMLDYTISYIVKDEVIATFTTNIANFYKITAPDIPQVAGYSTSWEEFSLRLETEIQVHAVYDLITYHVNFMADNNVVDVLEYNVENTEIESPEVPDKIGYTGDWEDFNLEIGDVTVLAEYTPIDYTARFVALDEIIGTETKLTYTDTFNVENFNIVFPAEKDYPKIDGCAVKWDEPVFEFNDIEIKGYYYDTDYTYLNFVPITVVDEFENEIIQNFYVSGLAPRVHDVENIVIPDKYHNIPVKYIAENAFEYDVAIKTLEIRGIETIEAYAFSRCHSILSVKLYDGIKTIGRNAFEATHWLETIKVPDTVTEIGESAFASSGIVTITLPKDLEKIPENLFNWCSDLEEIVLPEKITEIPYGTFYSCLSLTNVTLGSNVEVIREFAFGFCSSLQNITIPASVEIIECNAFKGCSELTSFDILDKDSNWYLVMDYDQSNSIALPKEYFESSTNLAVILKAMPVWGMYKEENN